MLLRSTKIGTWIRDSAANRVALWAAQRKTLLFIWTAQAFLLHKKLSCAGFAQRQGLRLMQSMYFCTDFAHFIFFVGIHTVQSHLYQLSPWAAPIRQTNNYSTQHEIPPRCPSRRSGDRHCLRRAHKGLRRAGHHRFHAVSGGGVDCGGGGLCSSSGGGGGGGGLRCNDVGQRVRSRWISGSRRGEQHVSSKTANAMTTIPGGEIVARWVQSTLSTAVRGGGSPVSPAQRG